MHSLAKSSYLAITLVLSCALSILFSACSTKTSDIVVATVGARTITLPEYESLYLKSNGGSRELAASSTDEDRKKFLELMTRFRLKLTDAYARGLDKSPEVQKEIDQYRGSLAQSYLTERDVTTPGVRKLYDRRTEEIRASHILLTLGTEASPADSQKAYQKASEIIAALNAGGDFTALALENSQDPQVKQNKGDLYFFSGGRMLPSFEDAVFAMKVGEFSQKPVRTIYGLHIIKVTSREPSRGELRCSHIMIRFNRQDPAPEDTLAAYKKITSLRDSITRGIDFAELAKRNSEDPGSAPQGGDLGWFSRGRWPMPFDETCFTLKPGQVSGIVRTVYGYHLIKCYDARPLKSFDELKKDLETAYKQQRFQDDYQKYLARLKKELMFSQNEKAVETFITALDSNKTTKDSAWAAGASAAVGNQPIMSFGLHAIGVDSIVAMIGNRPDLNNMPLRAPGIRSALDKIAEQLTFEFEGQTLERQDPAFVQIMKEYTEGILLYQVEQSQVWNRIAVSDSAMKVYFNAHRQLFTFPDRVDFSVISTANDSLAGIIRAQVASGKSFEEIAAADSLRMNAPSTLTFTFPKNSTKMPPQTEKAIAKLAEELRSDPALRLSVAMHPDTSNKKTMKLATQRIEAVRLLLTKRLRVSANRVTTLSGPQPAIPSTLSPAGKDSASSTATVAIVGRNPLVRGSVKTEFLPVTTDERTRKADSLSVGRCSNPFSYSGAVIIIRLNRKENARQKTIEEAGTEVSSAFQEYESKRLENEWLDALKSRYPIVEHPEVLKSAFVSVR